MCSCRPAGRWLPVLFVLGLMSWCYFVYMNDIVTPMIRDDGDDNQHAFGIGYCITFNVLLSLGLLSMARG